MYDNLVFVPPAPYAPPCDNVIARGRPGITAVGFALSDEGVQEKLTRLAGELGLPDYQLWVEAFGEEIVLAGLEEYDYATLPFSRLVEG